METTTMTDEKTTIDWSQLPKTCPAGDHMIGALIEGLQPGDKCDAMVLARLRDEIARRERAEEAFEIMRVAHGKEAVFRDEWRDRAEKAEAEREAALNRAARAEGDLSAIAKALGVSVRDVGSDELGKVTLRVARERLLNRPDAGKAIMPMEFLADSERMGALLHCYRKVLEDLAAQSGG